MQEEIFGPVLCILGVDSLDAAIALIQSMPGTPLTLYGFTSDEAVERRLLDECPSGNAAFNDVVVNFLNPHIPFGGLGTSGWGAQHGRHYFDACTQQRGVITKGTSHVSRLLDLQGVLRVPPYTPLKTGLVRALLTKLPVSLPPRYARKLALALLCFLVVWWVRRIGLHVVWLRYTCHAILTALEPAVAE